ncbi:hypothetical protein L218DRAFT_1078917 [Marasmius fiardii PR-910]|nr:hypothetical protein L218DRAFT_1078917 [Marasmius fiardii PR-910]
MLNQSPPETSAYCSKQKSSDESTQKATSSLKWSKNVIKGTIAALRIMEEVAETIPIPGLPILFSLTTEIIQAVNESETGFGLLAEEARALAFTLMDECKGIKETENDDNNASRYGSLVAHVSEFTRILIEIKEFAERRQKRRRLARFGSPKKDADLIKEYHDRLKATVVLFNVQSQIVTRSSLDRVEQSQLATGSSLNRIESLLLGIQETSLESEPVNARQSSSALDTTTVDYSSTTGPHNLEVVPPSLASPITQEPSLSQATPPLSSEAQSQGGVQASDLTRHRGKSSHVSDGRSKSISSVPTSITDFRAKSPAPDSRARSFPSSLRFKNPFVERLASSTCSEHMSSEPSSPTYAPNFSSSPVSDTQDPSFSFFDPARSRISVAGNVTVNNVVGDQSTTTYGATSHLVNTGNTYNTTTVNSNNEYEYSTNPSFHSSGPTYDFHPDASAYSPLSTRYFQHPSEWSTPHINSFYPQGPLPWHGIHRGGRIDQH